MLTILHTSVPYNVVLNPFDETMLRMCVRFGRGFSCTVFIHIQSFDMAYSVNNDTLVIHIYCDLWN